MYTYILIALLIFLLIGHFMPNLSQFRIVEGMENEKYQGYGDLKSNDPMFLATKNAANISAIKEQIDQLSGIQTIIQDISGRVSLNAFNIEQFVQASKKNTEALQKSANANLNSN